jgi:superfamily II DNA or RNA helicase
MTTKPTHQLTLKDKLSQLSYLQACRLLGERGEKLIQAGGKFEILPDQVHLDEDVFRLDLGEARATVRLSDGARRRLHLECSACDGRCEHMGAALSHILEDKMGLGLSAPPRERVPVESLSEAELVEQAVQERRERAREEKMVIKPTRPGRLWSDYLVTNRASGKTYRVALRGIEPGQSYCSCPDFRKSTLGTCKHIIRVIDKIAPRFSESALRRPYQRKRITVMLQYGERVALRLLVPAGMDREAARVVGRYANQQVDDPRALLRVIGKLGALGHSVTVYPDAEEYIHQKIFLAGMEATVAEIRRDPRRHPLRKTLLKEEPLPYQLDGIAFAVGAGRAVLADDMGLGKTIQGIGVAELLARHDAVRRVLIVCPASVKSQWRSEIRRFSDRSCNLVLGKASERARQYDGGGFFTVCNYEQVLRDIMAIERVQWDLIILDEGQRIKNWEAQTSRVIKALRSRFALVLSGTPLENRLEELYSVMEFIDDRRLGPAFRFLNRHRVVDEKGKVLGYKNLAELRHKLAPVLLRRTRESVMQQLPPRSTEIIRVTPTGEQLDLHIAQMRVIGTIVNKPYLTEMDLLRLQKALLICRMAADSTFLVDKRPPGYSSKLERLDELLEQLSREKKRKTLLFTEWTTMLGLIEPLIDKHGMPYVRLDGSVPQKKRQRLVHEFMNDPDKKLFVTTNAGATGLNLQAANTVINVDLPWNPAVLEQRIARAHRMGQKRPVQVFVLVTEETIEENMLLTLSAKHDLALAALDADSGVDAVDMVSGMDELKKRLEVLLGARAHAPLDQSERLGQQEQAERVQRERQQRVSVAGGQLLSAALAFLGELVPPNGKDAAATAGNGGVDRMNEAVRAQLDQCVQKDEQGRPTLTVTLPDASVLDSLAASLSRLLRQSQHGGQA